MSALVALSYLLVTAFVVPPFNCSWELDVGFSPDCFFEIGSVPVVSYGFSWGLDTSGRVSTGSSGCLFWLLLSAMVYWWSCCAGRC